MLVARGITRPLQRMTVAMNDLAGGKLDVEVPGIGRRDEVGEMAEAVEVFKSNAVARQGLEAAQKEAETARPPRGARRTCTSWRTILRARSARSSRRYPRLRPSLRLRPAR